MRPADRQAFEQRVRGERPVTPALPPPPPEPLLEAEASPEMEKSDHISASSNSETVAWLRSHLKLIVLGLVGLAVTCLLVYWLFLRSDHSGINEATYQQFVSWGKSTTFPVYYPGALPEGYGIETNSISSKTTTYSFIVTAPNGINLVVIEQPRPMVIERVTKTKDIATSLGKAYLANLNGQQAGFILTDKTLVTISSANASGDQLTQVIQSLRPLNQ